MLYSPLQTYLEKDGFFFMTDDMDTDRNEIMSLLDSDANVIGAKNYYDEEINYTVLDDEVFDALNLPLKSGNKFDSTDTNGLPKLIVSANTENIQSGDIVTDANGNEYQISAVLTDLSYLLNFSGYSSDMTYEDFYYTLDVNYEGYPHYYTCDTQIENLQLAYGLDSSAGSIVAYNSNVSAKNIDKDIQKISSYGIAVKNEDIARRSQSLLDDDFKKMIPPVFTFGIIVIIGALSCSVITSKNITYKLAVLYCCGASKSDCMKISSGNMVLITLIGSAIATVTLLAIKSSEIANTYGLVFKPNNICISLLIFVIFIFISVLIPSVYLSKNQPYDSLKNEEQE
jgi:ABC-type antimicrobial peptide transport system permease subunit